MEKLPWGSSKKVPPVFPEAYKFRERRLPLLLDDALDPSMQFNIKITGLPGVLYC
jgi:hypothetical protein